MTKYILQLLVVLLIAAQGVIGQTVQVVSLSNAAPGDILVQVDMDGYTDVSAITLYMEFDSDLLDYTGITNTTLTGTWVANYNAAIDKIIITYTAAPGYTNSPSGKLFDLQFYNKGGFSSYITFDEANCEIVEFLTPIATTYTDGTVTQGASVGTVSLDDLTEPIGNSIDMPVTIQGSGYGSVDAITLEVSFDETQLAFVSIDNSVLTGVVASANGGLLTINWTGTAQDFTSVTTIFDIDFVYYGGNAAVAFVPGCEITNSTNPLASSYVDGTVVPTSTTPTLTVSSVGGTPSGSVSVPIDAADFGSYQLGAMTLNLDFDISKLTYTGYTVQQLSGWVVNANGSGEINMQCSNTASSTLTDGSVVTLIFNYDAGGGEAAVTFAPGSIATSVNLVTIPVTFVDGSVASYSATFTVTDGTNPITDAVITFDGTTYAAGLYSFNDLGNGTYAYSVSKTGYTTVTGNVIVSGSDVTEPVTLQALYTVTFTVVDGASSPITDAVIIFDGTTYAAGTYVFSDLVNNTYAYSVSKTGYTTVTGSVIVSGSNVTESIVLNALFSVSGVLKYANTTGAVRPITSSTVYLKTSDGLTTIATTTTNATGNFTFTNVTAGNYLLDASTTKARGGLTLADYAIVRAFVTNGTPVLAGIYWTAADVNTSNTVTLADYAIIRNRVNTASTAGWLAANWIFLQSSITVSSANLTGANVTGICSGDVNASYTPPL